MSAADEHLAASLDILALLASNYAEDVRAGCMTPAQRVEMASTLGELQQQLLASLPKTEFGPGRGFTASGP